MTESLAHSEARTMQESSNYIFSQIRRGLYQVKFPNKTHETPLGKLDLSLICTPQGLRILKLNPNLPNSLRYLDSDDIEPLFLGGEARLYLIELNEKQLIVKILDYDEPEEGESRKYTPQYDQILLMNHISQQPWFRGTGIQLRIPHLAGSNFSIFRFIPDAVNMQEIANIFDQDMSVSTLFRKPAQLQQFINSVNNDDSKSELQKIIETEIASDSGFIPQLLEYYRQQNEGLSINYLETMNELQQTTEQSNGIQLKGEYANQISANDFVRLSNSLIKVSDLVRLRSAYYEQSQNKEFFSDAKVKNEINHSRIIIEGGISTVD